MLARDCNIRFRSTQLTPELRLKAVGQAKPVIGIEQRHFLIAPKAQGN